METNNQVSVDSSSADTVTRRRLFYQLWEEFGHLVVPSAADRRLHECGRLRRLEELSDISDSEAFVDPYDVQERFREKWTNDDAESHQESTPHSDPSPDWVSWNSYHLYTTAGTPSFVAFRGGAPDGGNELAAGDLVSSQLLLYRLIAVFGMPRPDEEKD